MKYFLKSKKYFILRKFYYQKIKKSTQSYDIITNLIDINYSKKLL